MPLTICSFLTLLKEGFRMKYMINYTIVLDL